MNLASTINKTRPKAYTWCQNRLPHVALGFCLCLTMSTMAHADEGVSYLTDVEQSLELANTSTDTKDSDTFLGRQGVDLINEIMKTSSLFGLLILLEEATPKLAITARYVGMLQEINQTNQRLDVLLKATNKNNQYLRKLVDLTQRSQIRAVQ